MSDRKLNTFRETTPNDGIHFALKGENDAKERRKEKEERGEGKKDNATFFLFILATLVAGAAFEKLVDRLHDEIHVQLVFVFENLILRFSPLLKNQHFQIPTQSGK